MLLTEYVVQVWEETEKDGQDIGILVIRIASLLIEMYGEVVDIQYKKYMMIFCKCCN